MGTWTPTGSSGSGGSSAFTTPVTIDLPLPESGVQALTATVDGLPNLEGRLDATSDGHIGLRLRSDLDGAASIQLQDEGTKDGITTLGTNFGLYVQPRSDASDTSTYLEVTNKAGADRFVVQANGAILVPSIPTADPHVVGQLWSNSGVLTVSAGP